jgi:hypothetical protein
MVYVLMFGIQVAFTVIVAVFINRRLLLQNVALRNQLGVYLRTIDTKKLKSQIRDRDRRLWLVLKRLLENWTDYLVIVKPKTVIDWERRRFTRFWKKKSQSTVGTGRPSIPEQHIEYIRRISGDHPDMGSHTLLLASPGAAKGAGK